MDSSGIYKITDKTTGQFYIGQSIDIQARMNQHFKGCESNPRLKKLMAEKGYDNFEFEIIEFCDKEELIKREAFYISAMKPQLNIQLGNTLTQSRVAPGIYKERGKMTYCVDTRKKINGSYRHLKKRNFNTIEEANRWLTAQLAQLPTK